MADQDQPNLCNNYLVELFLCCVLTIVTGVVFLFIIALMALVIITLIGTIITLLICLVVNPRVPQFQVDSLSLSNFNWNLQLTISNPNHKMNFSYGRMDAVIFHESRPISTATIPPFDQGTRNHTQVRACGLNLNQEVTHGGTLDFNLLILARVRGNPGVWHWKPRKRLLTVYCEELMVVINSNGTSGTMLGGPRQCSVDVFTDF